MTEEDYKYISNLLKKQKHTKLEAQSILTKAGIFTKKGKLKKVYKNILFYE